MSEQILLVLRGLWKLAKIAFEVLVLDFVASFWEGYRNARFRYQERFEAPHWPR